MVFSKAGAGIGWMSWLYHSGESRRGLFRMGTTSSTWISEELHFEVAEYFRSWPRCRPTTQQKNMVSHRGHNCISSALTILDSALTS